MKFKYILTHIDERKVTEDTPLLSVSKNRGVILRTEVSENGSRADDISHYKTCLPGDLVINKMSAYQGASGISKINGAISPDYMVVRGGKEIHPPFLGYLFKSSWMISTMSSLVRGIGSVDSGTVRTPRLNWSDLKEVEYSFPPVAAQVAIADELDEELSKIDELITKQEQLLVNIAERKRALIANFVTRGTSENTELKPTNIPWLPEIPMNWHIKPCWSLFRREKSTGYPAEELLSVYREYGVIPKNSRDDNHNVESEDLSAYQLVRVGDMVMNKMKAWQGSLALSQYRGIVSPAYFVYRPLHSENPKYLHYLLRSAPYVGHYFRISKGVRVGQWDLDPAHFRTTPVLLPPIEQQNLIVEEIENRVSTLDELRDATKKAIELLTERKSVLVAESIAKTLA